MAEQSGYISAQYNPHSLKRDWGLIVYDYLRPGIRDCGESQTLGTLRHTLFGTIRAQVNSIHLPSVTCSQSPDLSPSSQVHQSLQIPKVMFEDSGMDDGSISVKQLIDEVGLDTLTLALLGDVPLHRSLNLGQNALVGHWRWLRLVWRQFARPPGFADLPDNAPPPATPDFNQIQTHVTALASAELIDLVVGGRNNLAVAYLHHSFQQLPAPADKITSKHQSFLANLALFCPFIGLELLWQHNLIMSQTDKGTFT
ncbi:hypothetical protein LPB41_05725 [Thalassospira sp. MA62]|nr:hypothetical protein [Thalassospira sp. MA62]